ncbi:MAG: tryptophan--tRNA ligase [Bacteroidia bacterium]|nr:tryptophan--tRNA ligase [Bacteroidia bacterium]
MTKKNILSAIQPTGQIHLGNYLGAIQNWVKLQADYNCVYGVVDYHAMTMPYDAQALRNNTLDMIMSLVACGVKPENLFIQSLIPEHTELAWILNCVASYNELTRQTQFKDKIAQLEENTSGSFITAGLFTYPVLQAADILMYHPHFVPVGKDQEQHVELSRNVVNRFNYQFQTEYFHEPQVLFTETPKVQSLADPSKKMSKSLGEKHCVFLFEEESTLRKKIKTAVTDTGDTPEGQMSPGVENLFTIIKALGNDSLHQDLMQEYLSGAKMYGKLKEGVAETVVPFVNTLREKKMEIMEDADFMDKIRASSAEIRKKAQKTLQEVREITGLI